MTDLGHINKKLGPLLSFFFFYKQKEKLQQPLRLHHNHHNCRHLLLNEFWDTLLSQSSADPKV